MVEMTVEETALGLVPERDVDDAVDQEPADWLAPSALVRRLAEAPADGWAAAALSTVDPASLAPEDLPHYLRAWARAEAHAAARRLEAVRLVADAARRPGEVVDVGPHEVAVALRIPLGSASAQVHHARRLATHLPGTAAALAAGHISWPHALRVLEATAVLTDRETAAAVEARVLPKAPRQTPGELAGATARAVAAVDPAGFATRHRRAAEGSDVELTPDTDAMAWLTARMPLVDAVVVHRAVETYARARKASGDPRPLGVLRAEALRVAAERYLDDTRPTSHHRPVEIQLVAPLETWLGLSAGPGEIPGLGPVPADTIRALTEDARIRRLITDPTTGHLLDYGRRAYRPPADLAAFVRARYRRGAAPGTSAGQPVDIDHTTSWAEGGTTSPDNTTPQTRGWHRAKTEGSLTVEQHGGHVTWHTPLGQRADVEPYDYRLGP